MSAFIKLLLGSNWTLVAVAVAIAVAAAFADGYRRGKSAGLTTAAAKLEAAREAYDRRYAEAEAARAAAVAATAAREEQLAATRNQHEATLQQAYAQLDALERARRSADDRRVRDASALRGAVARQCASAAAPASASDGGGAAAVGDLVGDLLRFGAACALAAERGGAGIRALLGAWPTSSSAVEGRN